MNLKLDVVHNHHFTNKKPEVWSYFTSYYTQSWLEAVPEPELPPYSGNLATRAPVLISLTVFSLQLLCNCVPLRNQPLYEYIYPLMIF